MVQKGKPWHEFIDGLPDTGAPDAAGRVPFVDNSGTPTTRKATVANLAASAAFSDEYAPLADPTFTGTVIVPAATAATHAAQVTAIDAATGRLAIGGIELGDTDWRDVSAGLINGWTGTLLIRRTAQTVFFRGQITGDGTSQLSYFTLPGFRAGVMAGRWAFVASSTANAPDNELGIGFYGNGNRELRSRLADTDGVQHYFGAAYPTVDAWPTTLPGVAV